MDSLKVQRYAASLAYSQSEPCVDIGAVLPNGKKQGDVDCNDAVNAVDSLKLQRYGAGLTYAQSEPCPDIGT